MGRPRDTDEPRSTTATVRFTPSERRKLHEIQQRIGAKTPSAAIRWALVTAAKKLNTPPRREAA